MGATDTKLGKTLFREAQKFWFYAIATSILISLLQLWLLGWKRRRSSPRGKKVQAKDPPRLVADQQGRDLLIQLTIDGCDLFIPGAALGWAPIGMFNVGLLMAVSSILAIQGLWDTQKVATRPAVKPIDKTA